MKQAVIVSAARTAVGKAPNGALRSTRPDDMAAAVIGAVLDRAPGFDRGRVADGILARAVTEGANEPDAPPPPPPSDRACRSRRQPSPSTASVPPACSRSHSRPSG